MQRPAFPRRFAASTRGYLRDALRFAPGRPAVALGLRCALATMGPLVIGHALLPRAQTWACVAGFLVSLNDKGGSYRARARAMAGVAVGGAAAAAVAALAPPALAPPLMLAWAILCGLAGAWGPAAASAGSASAVLFAISLATPAASAAIGLERGLWVAAGGAWAMLLGLLLWPVRVYKPSRRALAHCLRLLSDHADELARLAPEAGSAVWQTRVQGGHRAIREALEVAAAVLAATRRGRGETGRGERLLVVLQTADHVFGALVALEDVVETARRAGLGSHALVETQRTVAGAAGTLRTLADRVVLEGRLPPWPPLTWDPAALRAVAVAPVAQRAQLRHAAEILGRLRIALESAAETIDTLHDQRPLPSAVVIPPPALRPPLAEPLREHLALDSVVLRHALRLGVAAGAAVALTTALGLPRGYWVTVTVIVLLQPYAPATVTKGLQRIGGTVLGGIAAALIATALRDPRAIMVVAFVLAGLSAAVLQINYGLYSLLLTPTFVLLAEVSAGDWHLATVRVMNTLLGGALAFTASWMLWPSRERERFPAHAAAAIAALRGHAAAVVDTIVTGAPPPAHALAAARRRFGVAVNNAETSLQRLFAESRAHPDALEPAMTMLLYLRRVSASLTALASTRTLTPQTAGAALRPFVTRVDAVLADLEAAVRGGRPPAPLPALDDPALDAIDPVLAARRARLVEQLDVLHQAVARDRR